MEDLARGGPKGEGILRMFLLRESTNWIQMGRQYEFFSTDLEPFPIRFGRLEGYGLSPDSSVGQIPFSGELNYKSLNDVWFKDWSRARADTYMAFDEALMEAMDALSQDRLEFLRLYLFADDAEWKDKIAELAVIQSLLEGGERSAFPGEFMDGVTWAFDGLESDLDHYGYPSDWRATSFSDIRLDSARAESLGGILHSIESSVRKILETESEQALADGEHVRESQEGFRQAGGDDIEKL